MCHDRSWFVSQDNKAKAKAGQPAAKDERSETVKALLRDSQEEAQRKATERKPAPEPVPAK
jgi:hypothetical protein